MHRARRHAQTVRLRPDVAFVIPGRAKREPGYAVMFVTAKIVQRLPWN
jgi:hypothetical protein